MGLKRDGKTLLQKEINRVTTEMTMVDPASEEYSIMAENLEKLMEAQKKIESLKVSPDTLLVVTGGLLEVLLILHYEKIGYITSKALSFVIKGRVK